MKKKRVNKKRRQISIVMAVLFGAAIIWAPIGLIMCFTGPIWKGILFLILSIVIISNVM